MMGSTEITTELLKKRINVIRGFSKLNPVSLSACHPGKNNLEVILISEFVISEIRINSTKNCLKLSLFRNSWIHKSFC